MTAAEAKTRIKEEFMAKYYEWLTDYRELSDHDYGWKYGWQKSQNEVKDNQQGVLKFTKYMFCAFRTGDQWARKGYDRRAILDLAKEGFLSEALSNRQFYYYISQRSAKQIYKESKGESK